MTGSDWFVYELTGIFKNRMKYTLELLHMYMHAKYGWRILIVEKFYSEILTDYFLTHILYMHVVLREY